MLFCLADKTKPWTGVAGASEQKHLFKCHPNTPKDTDDELQAVIQGDVVNFFTHPMMKYLITLLP